MTTDPREFEHPIDGTGESVTAPTPPLVDVIAAALDTHHRIISQSLHQGCLCGWVGEVLGYDHAAHQARAVLAAMEEGGAVELTYGLQHANGYVFECRNLDEATALKHGTKIHGRRGDWANHAIVAKQKISITGPWTAVQ